MNSGEIQGNTIYKNNGTGINIEPNWSNSWFNIYNNTIANNQDCGLFFQIGCASGSRVENNIFSGNNNAGLIFNQSEEFWIFFNDFFNNGQNIISDNLNGIGNIVSSNYNGDPCDLFSNIFLDPQFMNEQSANFELSANSPCRNAGNPNSIYNDINGTLNDIGDSGGSDLRLTTTKINFGSSRLNHALDEYFEIINNREKNVTIANFKLNDEINFFVSEDTPLIVSPMSSESIKIIFNPQNSGSFDVILRIIGNDFYGTQQPEISLIGEGFKATTVSGNISGVWERSNSPYVVISDVTIPKGQVLTIEPGVNVIAESPTPPRYGPYRFEVLGKLMAIGTNQDSILFSGFFGNWQGIYFSDAEDTSIFQYCNIQDGNGITIKILQ